MTFLLLRYALLRRTDWGMIENGQEAWKGSIGDIVIALADDKPLSRRNILWIFECKQDPRAVAAWQASSYPADNLVSKSCAAAESASEGRDQ